MSAEFDAGQIAEDETGYHYCQHFHAVLLVITPATQPANQESNDNTNEGYINRVHFCLRFSYGFIITSASLCTIGGVKIMLVADAVNQFIAARGGRKSLRTRELYQERLRLFESMHADVPVEQLSGEHVAIWLDVLERRGYAPATMAGYRQAIKAFFRWCVENKLLASSPAAELRIGSFISRRLKLPNSADVDRAVAEARRWCQTDDPQQVRDGLIVLLSRTCGPRSREIRQLRLSEVKRALGVGPTAGVYVLSSQGKTGETLLRFGEDVAAGFRQWLAIRPKTAVDVCFVTLKQVDAPGDADLRYRPLARRSLDGAYERVCQAAGVGLIRSHAYRHYIGHMAAQEHGPKIAAIILNHRDAATAQTAIAYYHHPDDADVNRAVLELGHDSAEPEDPLNALFRRHR